MAKQTINIGASPNDGTGTPLRTSFDYCNLNFTELYTAVGPSGNNIVVPGSATITGDLTVRTNQLIVNSVGAGAGYTPSGAADKLSSALTLGVVATTNTTADLNFRNGSLTAIQRLRYTDGSGTLTIGSATGIAYPVELGGDTGSRAVTIDGSKNVGIGVTPSAGKGVLQLSSGINFPATQVASSDANTLDDYVETTFSPTIVGSTVAGTATYTTQIGRATKIGRLVTFSIRVAYSAGTGIGNLRVGNLPFAAGSGSVFAVYAENIALTAGNYPVCGITSGNTFISIDQLPTGGGAATAVPYDAAGDIQISGSYIV